MFQDEEFEKRKQEEKDFHDKVKDISLPDWLVSTFPSHLPHTIVSYSDGAYLVSHDNTEFTDVVEAYRHATAARDEYQVVLDGSLHLNGGELVNGFFLCDVEPGNRSAPLLLSSTTEEVVTVLKHCYRVFLYEIAENYIVDCRNYKNSLSFIRHHPAFWTKSVGFSDFRWKTNVSLQELGLTADETRQDGLHLTTLGINNHVTGKPNRFSSDQRITVSAPSFEEAIVALAAKVDDGLPLTVESASKQETKKQKKTKTNFPMYDKME